MTKIFIDGSAGTTGLRINERLAGRADIELIKLPSELRKDSDARRDAIHTADVAFFCLPDAASVEAAALAEGSNTVIIDTSTAHRTNDAWAYGFPELFGAREKILTSKHIANPGCHASGFIVLIEPLIHEGILKKDAVLSCFSLTGYSGGGKGMIADYESDERSVLLKAPRQYGLPQQHKHLKEMQKLTGLELAPAFCPVVADYYSGMEVTVPVFKKDLRGSVEDIIALYKERYHSNIVKFVEGADEGGFMAANALSGKDTMEVTVCGNEDRILLVSRFDNLGKGASGAAIQNMNIILGVNEETGLSL